MLGPEAGPISIPDYLATLDWNPYALADHERTRNIGAAVYPGISMVYHSCTPNVRYDTVIRSGKLYGQLVALRDVAPGEEILTDYTNNGYSVEADGSIPPDIRYQMLIVLAESHQFTCHCDACFRCIICSKEADTCCNLCGVSWCSKKCRRRDTAHHDACQRMAHIKDGIQGTVSNLQDG